MRYTRKRLVDGLLVLLVACLPFGTRYIVVQGSLMGYAVEWGTASIYATWFLAAAYAAVSLQGRKAEHARRSPPFGYAALFAAVVALESAPRIALLGQPVVWPLCSLAVAVVACFAVARHKDALAVAARGFVAGGAVQAGLAVWQVFAQVAVASKWLGMAPHAASDLGASVIETADARWLRAYGSFPHPNMLGLYLTVALACAVMLAATARLRWPFVISLPLLATGLFFSFSRSALVGLIAGVVIIVVSPRDRHEAHVRGKSIAAAVIVAVTFVSLSFVFSEQAAARASAYGRLERRSIEDRLSQVVDAALLFGYAPAFGVGMGMSVPWLAFIEPTRPWWKYEPVHDLPAVIAVETGAAGLLAWLAFVVSSFIASRRGARHVLSAIPLAAAMLAAGLFDHFLWTSWQGLALFWIVFGLLIGSSQDQKNS